MKKALLQLGAIALRSFIIANNLPLRWNLRLRRLIKARLKIAVCCMVICVLALVGCTNQATIAALVTTLGNATAAVATIEGNPELAAKLKTDTALASSAVLAWKTGTPAQNVIQALNLVEADLNLFPVSSKYSALIILAIGTAESIIAIVNPPAVAAGSAPTVTRKVTLSNPPKTAAQLKAQWNKIAVGSLADARIN